MSKNKEQPKFTSQRLVRAWSFLLLLIYLVMSFPSDTSPWAVPAPETSPEITVESALEKERVIKDIVTLRDGLRGLMVRITEVEGDNDKLKRENEMLAQYMENL